MSDKDNITVIRGGATPNPSADAMRSFAAEIPALLGHMRLMAQLHHAKFVALRTEGFSETQALELCKSVF